MSEDEFTTCDKCDYHKGHVCCDDFSCDPAPTSNEVDYSFCIHCGTTMEFIDGDWYCHEQINQDGRANGKPQKYGR